MKYATAGSTIFAIVLLLIISTEVLCVPQLFVSAYSPPSVTPNPATIGQLVTVSFGGQTSVSTNITKPDGTWYYQKSGTKDYQYFTPDQIGTYEVQLLFSDNTTYMLTLEVKTWLSPTPSPSPSTSLSPTATVTPTPIYTPTATPRPKSSPTPAITASPSPTPEQAILATTDNGATVDLRISGNVTSSQLTNITIATNQSSSTTTISFTVTGQSGTTGFSNITIPNKAVSNGARANIDIDGQPAQNQGYTQDTDSYYVWYTTYFSTHEVSIVFTAGPSAQIPPFDMVQVIIILVSAVVAAVSVGAFVFFSKRDKN